MQKVGYLSSPYKTTYFNLNLPDNMDILNEQPAISESTHLITEKTPNCNEITKQNNDQTSQHVNAYIATFIKDTIDSENIPIISDHEVTATLVKFQKPLAICNIYIPDSKMFTKQHLKDIIQQLPKPLVLLGDFNSCNISWGCTYIDYRGQMVEEFLEDETLILLNNSDPTRHNVSNGTFFSIILTITNIKSSTLFDWQVLSAYSSSDHWPIGIQYYNHCYSKKLNKVESQNSKLGPLFRKN